MNASTFARYCVVDGVHGVGVCAPKSSLRAISGLSQADDFAAFSNSCSARPRMLAASTGAEGEPIRLWKLRSK
jgi:hypothetical protein